MTNPKTPEEIVAMMGNVANRPDIAEVQLKQVEAIRQAMEQARREAIEDCLALIDNKAREWKERSIKNTDETDSWASAAAINISDALRALLK